MHSDPDPSTVIFSTEKLGPKMAKNITYLATNLTKVLFNNPLSVAGVQSASDICNVVKFRYCEKATKFEKISQLSLKFPTDVKTKWEIL